MHLGEYPVEEWAGGEGPWGRGTGGAIRGGRECDGTCGWGGGKCSGFGYAERRGMCYCTAGCHRLLDAGDCVEEGRGTEGEECDGAEAPRWSAAKCTYAVLPR